MCAVYIYIYAYIKIYVHVCLLLRKSMFNSRFLPFLFRFLQFHCKSLCEIVILRQSDVMAWSICLNVNYRYLRPGDNAIIVNQMHSSRYE